jgi:hypothetical protein
MDQQPVDADIDVFPVCDEGEEVVMLMNGW